MTANRYKAEAIKFIGTDGREYTDFYHGIVVAELGGTNKKMNLPDPKTGRTLVLKWPLAVGLANQLDGNSTLHQYQKSPEWWLNLNINKIATQATAEREFGTGERWKNGPDSIRFDGKMVRVGS
jgi:hypothetical protein